MNKNAEIKWGELVFTIFVLVVLAFSFDGVKRFFEELIGTILTILLLIVILVLVGILVYWWFNREESNDASSY